MEKLAEQKLGGQTIAQALTEQEIEDYRAQVPKWTLVEGPTGERQLERTFQFQNFIEALDFAMRIGETAEEQQHHPRLVIEPGQVTVTWWTHSVRGLRLNDFIMAAKTDTIYAEF